MPSSAEILQPFPFQLPSQLPSTSQSSPDLSLPSTSLSAGRDVLVEAVDTAAPVQHARQLTTLSASSPRTTIVSTGAPLGDSSTAPAISSFRFQLPSQLHAPSTASNLIRMPSNDEPLVDGPTTHPSDIVFQIPSISPAPSETSSRIRIPSIGSAAGNGSPAEASSLLLQFPLYSSIPYPPSMGSSAGDSMKMLSVDQSTSSVSLSTATAELATGLETSLGREAQQPLSVLIAYFKRGLQVCFPP